MAQDKQVAMSTSASAKTSNCRKKRKRPRQSVEDQLEQEQREKYDKLVYNAKKALHKEAKVVKSFECQKMVRKLKQQQEGCNNNEKLQERLQQVKRFPLDELVEVCLQRLGIPNLNPIPETTMPSSASVNPEENNDESQVTDDSARKQDNRLLERMLQHKRLVMAMETWNEKVTEYRRWYLQRQERVSEPPVFVSQAQKKKKKKRNSKKAKSQAKEDPSSPSNELFVCLSGTPTDEVDNSYYGPGGDGEQDDEFTSVVKKKKNRPGQRSRKAKAMAIQARKEGRTWDRSLNWREKKPKPQHEETSTYKNDVPTKAQPEEIATMGKTWKEEGQAHPSWAARQSQKSGIVEFAGKKITFD